MIRFLKKLWQLDNVWGVLVQAVALFVALYVLICLVFSLDGRDVDLYTGTGPANLRPPR